MKKLILLFVLTALFGNGIYAQSSDQIKNPTTAKQHRFEATLICLDAIEEPTKYNAFAKGFVNLPTFPKKKNKISQESFKTEIKAWLVANPTMTDKILLARKKAHDILYGPHPH